MEHNAEINMRAVRAFARVWNPLADRISEGQAASHGYDAGEFTGDFYANLLETTWNHALQRVAARFGMEPAQLEWNIHASGYRELEMHMNVIAKGN